MKYTVVWLFLALAIITLAPTSHATMQSRCNEQCSATYTNRLAFCDNDYSSNGIMVMRQVCREEASRDYNICLRNCPGRAFGPVQPIDPWGSASSLPGSDMPRR